jgi:hypothetical protein
MAHDAQAFDGHELLKDLFTEFAPFLSLFGGQVTTQFLSTMLGWADVCLLAAGPLGVLTVIVKRNSRRWSKVFEGFGWKASPISTP